MKKDRIWVAISWVAVIIISIMMIWNGYLRDVYGLTGESYLDYILWILLFVFCKCKFLKFADKNGEFCISVLEKVAGCPAGLPDAS